MAKNSKKKNSNAWWIFKITLTAVIISFMFSLASESVLPKVNMVLGFLILILFILIGVIFDMVGVAITAADIGPFNAMSAKKIKGANVAIKFLQNADKVSSFCNDVVGDICGIISGTASATLAITMATVLKVDVLMVALILTAITSSLTIGGKAICKSIAIKNSTSIVFGFSKIVSLFYYPKK